MAELSIRRAILPKGKKVFDFFQELYSDDNARLQNAWFFLYNDVTIALRNQLVEPVYDGGRITLYLFHEVEDRHVGEITFDLLSTINSWHLVRQIRCHGDSSHTFSYSADSIILPTEVFFISMQT